VDITPFVPAIGIAITGAVTILVTVMTANSNHRTTAEEHATPSYTELGTRNSDLERMNTAKGNLIWRLEYRINELVGVLVYHKLRIPSEDDSLDRLRQRAWNKDKDD
jgi:hypothetical protein